VTGGKQSGTEDCFPFYRADVTDIRVDMNVESHGHLVGDPLVTEARIPAFSGIAGSALRPCMGAAPAGCTW
jgi:hypothetical protein